MKSNRTKLILCLAIPLAVGGLAGFLSRSGMETFKYLVKPPLTPPGWLFPVVWTILYLLMGIASWRVLISGDAQSREALRIYGIQLFFNFVWPILFFNLELRLLALIWLAMLWLLIFATASRFRKISKSAGNLLIPYLVWTAFAGYLNAGIYMVN